MNTTTLTIAKRTKGAKLLKIRQERQSDYDKVYELVKMSFATTYAEGEKPDEQDYLNEIRQKETFIPELSLVAEKEDGTLIGQIVLYKTTITTQNEQLTELVLSPICVHPDYFKQGIARAMIEKAIQIAKEMGFRAVFLCGDSKIYEKMGFTPSYHYNIFHKNDESKTADWSMVRELYSGALVGISGIVDTL